MRRALAAAVVAVLAGMAGPARDAGAGASVDLLFIGRNGVPIATSNTLDAAAGDVLTMAVLLRNDQPLAVALFSLLYDLDGNDELDVVSAFAWQGFGSPVPGPFFQPSALLPPTATFVGPFGGSTALSPIRPLPVAGGAFAGGYQVGTVTWKVNAGVDTDGADILSSLEDLGIGPFGFGDAGFNLIDGFVRFNAATVNVPEPGTASLLGLGLVGLFLTGRRRSASRRR
jgi:hypothetical protein